MNGGVECSGCLTPRFREVSDNGAAAIGLGLSIRGSDQTPTKAVDDVELCSQNYKYRATDTTDTEITYAKLCANYGKVDKLWDPETYDFFNRLVEARWGGGLAHSDVLFWRA